MLDFPLLLAVVWNSLNCREVCFCYARMIHMMEVWEIHCLFHPETVHVVLMYAFFLILNASWFLEIYFSLTEKAEARGALYFKLRRLLQELLILHLGLLCFPLKVSVLADLFLLYCCFKETFLCLGQREDFSEMKVGSAAQECLLFLLNHLGPRLNSLSVIYLYCFHHFCLRNCEFHHKMRASY